VQTHEATHTVITPSVLYFGTPVGLISTLNRDGTTNLSPVSSLFALGQRYAVGLGAGGQAAANLIDCPELVVNLPDAELAGAIEEIAPTTGVDPVPQHKAARYRFEPDKWTLGGLTPLSSELVRPDRVMECPIQLGRVP